MVGVVLIASIVLGGCGLFMQPSPELQQRYDQIRQFQQQQLEQSNPIGNWLKNSTDYATGGANRGADGGFCYGCQGGYAPPLPTVPPAVICSRSGNTLICQ